MKFFWILVFVVSSSILVGQTYSNEYMRYGVGARSHGMGFSVTATSKGVNGAYWNPARMDTDDAEMQMGAMHSIGFGGVVTYNQIGVSKAFGADKNRFGALTIIRQAIDDIPYTINFLDASGQPDFSQISSFSTADYGVLISFGSSIGISEKWRYGVNGKVLRRHWGDFAGSWGIGLDFGVQYIGERFHLGIMARDITTTYNSWTNNFSDEEIIILQSTGNEPLKRSNEITYPSVTTGFAYSVFFSEQFNVLLASDINFTFDGARNVLLSQAGKSISIDPHVGLEIGFQNSLFLRGGIGSIQKFQELRPDANGKYSEELVMQPTAGIGLQLGVLGIDYALSTVGDTDVELSHIFSLTYKIGRIKNSNRRRRL